RDQETVLLGFRQERELRDELLRLRDNTLQESRKSLLHRRGASLVERLCIVDPKTFCPIFSDEQRQRVARGGLVVRQGFSQLDADRWDRRPLPGGLRTKDGIARPDIACIRLSPFR